MVPAGTHSASAELRFTLNGRCALAVDVPAQLTLLDFVRSEGLTGAKEGCAEGECGACAVLLVCPDESGAGAVYRPVNSCLVPLPAVAGLEILTVEGLPEDGRLAEVQRAMAAGGGSQCGYCTPGFVVSMFAEQYRHAPGQRDVHALGGNLCRCTGYRPIRDALLSLGPAAEGAHRERLRRTAPLPVAHEYRSAAGRYSRPASLAGCLALAAENPGAEFVSGNTDLGIATNLRDRRFAHLIGLDGTAELREFTDTPAFVEIGAGLTLSEIGERWREVPAVFQDWLPLFASVLIRNRATWGGNLATASPIGDSAPLLLALDASVRIASMEGERVMPLAGFFKGYRKTAMRPGEILRSVRIPKPFPEQARFFKVARRSLDDISTVAACIAISGSGPAEKVRIAFGGVAPTPVRAFEAELAIEGTSFEDSDLAAAQAALRETLRPIGDHRGSAGYRLAMAQSLLAKFHAERSEALC